MLSDIIMAFQTLETKILKFPQGEKGITHKALGFRMPRTLKQQHLKLQKNGRMPPPF